MAAIKKPMIKICGITRMQEAEYLTNAGVDFAGFVVFFPKSRRNVELERAQEIMARLKEGSPDIKTVAVTVSPTIEQVEAIWNTGFDYIQIHGSFPDDVKKAVRLPVFRAYNIENSLETEEVISDDRIAAVVFDGKIPGNGETFDWSVLKKFDRKDKLLMLAGGLTADNVKKAVMEVAPDIVDVSSWVEYEGEFKGKDPEKINAFAAAVRNAV